MLEKLHAFPQQLRELISSAPKELVRVRAKDGRFAFVEHAWHLADLEEEGYGVRIRRILEEDHPQLPDFRGDVIAEERKYLEQELEPALVRFAEARAANLARLEAATNDWQRTGEQEGVGRVTLARVVEMMAEHDAGHAEDLHALLEELT